MSRGVGLCGKGIGRCDWCLDHVGGDVLENGVLDAATIEVTGEDHGMSIHVPPGGGGA